MEANETHHPEGKEGNGIKEKEEKEGEIKKEEIDLLLFKFLRSMYLFEKREVSLFGITWDEAYLLHLLNRSPGMPVSEAARQMKVKDFVTSRMITRLCKEELVLRKGAKGDKRVVRVYITEQGRRKLEDMEQYNYGVILSKLDTVPVSEIRELMRSIDRLGDFLGLE